MARRRGSDPVGRIGRVTGRLGPDELGEVTLPFDGGTQAYLARAVEPEAVLKVGTRVLVVDFDAPLTVYVTEYRGVA